LCDGRLGQQLAARQEPFLPLAGDLVDGHLPLLGFRVRREELAEVAGQRRVRDRAGPAHAAATLTPARGGSTAFAIRCWCGGGARRSAPPRRSRRRPRSATCSGGRLQWPASPASP